MERELIMNFIKKEIDELKKNTDGMTNTQKFDHIYYYYKFHFVFLIVMTFFIGSLIHTITTQKDPHFYGLFINVSPNENERNYLSDFYAESFDVNLSKESITFDDTLFLSSGVDSMMDIAGQEKLVALIATSTVDVVATEEETFYSLAYSNMMHDLRDCFSEEELEKYEPYLCYIDKEVLDRMESARYETPAEEFVIEPYPATLEEMIDPMPVGLLVGNNTNLGKSYRFMGNGIMGIPGTTKQLENAKNFISVALN